MRRIIGIDEAGRGSWAGPLVAAAVVIVKPRAFPRDAVRDSKLLTDSQRRILLKEINASCLIAYGAVSNRLIDRIGIQAANVMAVDRALEKFAAGEYIVHSDYIGNFHRLSSSPAHVVLHIRGESLYPAIAAASIAAKVFRDTLMIGYHRDYPQYFFAEHKGYGTEHHRHLLQKYGPSPLHRLSFRPLQQLTEWVLQ